MKKVLHLFVLALLIGHQAFANHGAVLNVESCSMRFNVSVNQTMYPHNRANLTLADLLPGAYRVQVWNDVTPNRYSRHQAPVYLYDAWVTLKPFERFTISVERGGFVRTYSEVHAPAPVIVTPAPVCNKPFQSSFNTYVPAPVFYGMAPDAFYSLKQAVINRSFDSTKRELLASALRNNQITSQQLYELLNLLDFESSKVEIAKLGYGSVVDKQNFYRIYDAFTFDSSISELQRHIG